MEIDSKIHHQKEIEPKSLACHVITLPLNYMGASNQLLFTFNQLLTIVSIHLIYNFFEYSIRQNTTI